jgi:hypothetical protein
MLPAMGEGAYLVSLCVTTSFCPRARTFGGKLDAPLIYYTTGVFPSLSSAKVGSQQRGKPAPYSILYGCL